MIKYFCSNCDKELNLSENNSSTITIFNKLSPFSSNCVLAEEAVIEKLGFIGKVHIAEGLYILKDFCPKCTTLFKERIDDTF